MDLGLKGKIIIVTGGSKGIGSGIVSVLLEEGAIPIIVGRDKKTIMPFVWKIDGFSKPSKDPKGKVYFRYYNAKFPKPRKYARSDLPVSYTHLTLPTNA